MPANSALRRAVKAVSAPVLGDTTYSWLQAATAVRDIRAGRLTEPELALIPEIVQPGDVAIDVGANLGSYTLPLSRAVGQAGVVFAFEPVPFTARALRNALRLTRARNVNVENAGCGETAGSLQFEVPLQASGAMSTGQAHASHRQDHREGREDHVRWEESTEVECPVVRLDDVIPKADWGRTSFLKADVEGMELAVLRGGQGILRESLPLLVIEINPWFLDGFGIDLADLLGLLEGIGYAAYRMNEDSGTLRSVRPEEIDEDNYVFAAEHHRERLSQSAKLT